MSLEHLPKRGSFNAEKRVDRLAYRIEEFKELTGLSRSGIYQYIATGVLPTAKIGRVTLILHEDAVDFLRSHRRLVM